MSLPIKKYISTKDKQSLLHNLYEIKLFILLNYKELLKNCHIYPYGHSFYIEKLWHIGKHNRGFAVYQKITLNQLLGLDNIDITDFIVVDEIDLKIITDLLKMTADISNDIQEDPK